MIERCLLVLIHLLPAELAHNLTIKVMQLLPWTSRLMIRKRPQKSSLKDFSSNLFNSPIGIAAGLDKNALTLKFWDDLGVGALEVGTVTPFPQVGNTYQDLRGPRIKRLPGELSLWNQMGFPNDGCDIILKRIKNYHNKTPIAVNIGPNKNTPHEQVAQKYLDMAKLFSPFVRYITINVSSPNTAGLRELQNESHLHNILSHLRSDSTLAPLVLKLSPDMDPKQLLLTFSIAAEYELAAVIIGNTTQSLTPEGGGCSGAALTKISQHNWKLALDFFNKNSSPTSVIACGGFMNYQNFYDYFSYGGKLVQVYSALTFRGFSVITEALQAYQNVYGKS